MSSGVLVNAECQNVFQQLSEGKHKLRYIIYKIEDKEVVVEAAVSPDEVTIHLIDKISYSERLENQSVPCSTPQETWRHLSRVITLLPAEATRWQGYRLFPHQRVAFTIETSQRGIGFPPAQFASRICRPSCNVLTAALPVHHLSKKLLLNLSNDRSHVTIFFYWKLF